MTPRERWIEGDVYKYNNNNMIYNPGSQAAIKNHGILLPLPHPPPTCPRCAST
ncbi:hypothetical protein K443DRAFT_685752 [Laccaria amethystina LaAM-08-1]|uniref:Unplaced genomic scaffold K443scaffold_437, whole genome shotgun sequence n=1 Tax=Laccaria amethystina LaAM-08-1 TaxID=1095629 RepID=A0A0C9WN94_9AGAR|nr:hypothetical protein K443DRAFT_685752 [Laccaria amethystina LaAM-08-1]